MASQARNHTTPSAEVSRKQPRHPNTAFKATNAGGPIIAATFVPALKTPVAKARSFLGNHSATALMAAGKFPASPKPSMALQKPKPIVERASTCNPAAKDHHRIDVA